MLRRPAPTAEVPRWRLGGQTAGLERGRAGETIFSIRWSHGVFVRMGTRVRPLLHRWLQPRMRGSGPGILGNFALMAGPLGLSQIFENFLQFPGGKK